MTTIAKITFFIVSAYIAVGLLAYVYQRKLQYFPETRRVAPRNVGVAGVKEVILTATDGVRFINWYAPASEGKKTVVFFQGNGGAIWHRTERFEAYRTAGLGVLFHSYRGYGGSGGEPAEKDIISDALQVLDWLAKQGVAPDDIVLTGESLGSGVAVQVAVKREPALVILEAPFTSAADIGASAYPLLPVKLFMKDPYRSDLHIGRIKAPLIIVHGDHDKLIPITNGRALFDAAASPKRFITIAGAGHAGLSRPEVLRMQIELITNPDSWPRTGEND